MSKKNLQEISFLIISHCGEAKSLAMEAMMEIKKQNKEEALNKLKEAEKQIIEAEKQHMDLIVEEANGIKQEFTILFMHSEDQLLSTQTLILVVREFIEIYEKLDHMKGIK